MTKKSGCFFEVILQIWQLGFGNESLEKDSLFRLLYQTAGTRELPRYKYMNEYIRTDTIFYGFILNLSRFINDKSGTCIWWDQPAELFRCSERVSGGLVSLWLSVCFGVVFGYYCYHVNFLLELHPAPPDHGHQTLGKQPVQLDFRPSVTSYLIHLIIPSICYHGSRIHIESYLHITSS